MAERSTIRAAYEPASRSGATPARGDWPLGKAAYEPNGAERRAARRNERITQVTTIFGEPWDAPVCEGAAIFPEVPTYAACLLCGEHIKENDQGFIMPMALAAGGEKRDAKYFVGGGDDYALIAEHRECNLSQTVGHMVGVCSCTGWDTGSRDTGREVLRRVMAGALG